MDRAIAAPAKEMEQATVAGDGAKMSAFTCRVVAATLLSVLLSLAAVTPAGAGEQERAFERSGIHYPDGFDPNTVGELHGKVTGLYRLAGASNLVVFNLETTWERYTVAVCPPWYWDELKIKVSIGEDVRVIGSKALGKDSNLYMIVQEIHFVEQGKTITLRSKTGTPLWDVQHGKTDSGHGVKERMRRQQ
jgi:hypothetical protein